MARKTDFLKQLSRRRRAPILAGLAIGGALLFAQQQTLVLQAPPPPPVSNVTATASAPGLGFQCWWVIAIYPIGKSVPTGPTCLQNPGGTVTVRWGAVAGATGYDVLRQPTQNLPSGTANSLVHANAACCSQTDTLGALTSYTVSSAGPASATLRLDNQANPQPRVYSDWWLNTWKVSTLTFGDNTSMTTAAAAGATGPQGPSGPQGATGATGPGSADAVQGASSLTSPNVGNVPVITAPGQIGPTAALPDPTAPVVSATCTGTCATSYGYKIIEYNGAGWTLPSPESAAVLNAASLDSSNFNSITLPLLPGASCLVVRSTGSLVPQLLGGPFARFNLCDGSTIADPVPSGQIDAPAFPTVNSTFGSVIPGFGLPVIPTSTLFSAMPIAAPSQPALYTSGMILLENESDIYMADDFGNVLSAIQPIGDSNGAWFVNGPFWKASNLAAAGDTLANLTTIQASPSLGGSSLMTICTDCDTPASPGAVCTSSGDHAGAVLFHIRSVFICF